MTFRTASLCVIAFSVGFQSVFAQTTLTAEAGAVRLDVRRSSSAAHVPLHRSQLVYRVTNARDEPLEGLCVMSFDDQPSLQYGRRVWVPPQAHLTTWHPFRVPDGPPADPRNPKIREIPFRSSLYDSGNAKDRLVTQEAGRMQLHETLWLMHPEQVIGLVAPANVAFDDSAGIELYNFVLTGRVGQSIKYNYVLLGDGLPPGGEESLDGFDQLVIADDRVLDDLAALTAVRRWLFGGGRLWVMLDRVDPSVLESLLGDEFAAQIVDRVGLTQVHLETGPLIPPSEEKPRDFDRPVELVRMIADDLDVAYTAGGWPAACWKKCGQGKLLITTLGPDGWVRPRDESDGKPHWGGELDTGFVSGPAFDDLMSQFLVFRPKPLLEPEALESHAREYVGYTVPSKGVVVGVLSGFTLCLIAAGAWLLRSGEAQRLGMFGPVVALAASLSLMAVGRQHRSLPEMTAVTQFVQPIPGTSDVRSTGAAATFVSQTRDVAFSGHHGWLMPSDTSQSVGTRRVVWAGLDRWRWENLRLTQGLHSSQFQSAALIDFQTSAEAHLDAEGITGRLGLPDGLVATDGILVTPSGKMNVEFDGDGLFRAHAEDVLTGGQYLTEGLLSDEQAQRGRTLAEFLESPHGDYPTEPTLLFWTDRWELGTAFPSESQLEGSALVALPFSIKRPSAGTEINVPSPFISYREGLGPGLEYLTGVYNHRTRTWIERTIPATTWLRFLLPPGIAPVRPTAARLTIQVSGAMGRLEVAAVRDGEPVSVKTWDDPVGTLHLDLHDPALLQPAEDGTLMLRIAFGNADQPASGPRFDPQDASAFRIDSLALRMKAVVLDAGSETTTLPMK